MKLQTILSQIALLGLLARTGTAAPLGTAFTYQGKLTDGGNPANGSFDLTFTLFDTNSGGWAVAGPLTNSAVAVSNGLFTVALDFGTGVFTGDARWLEIGVRTNGRAADFTVVSPRQPVTAVPYAFYAPASGTAASAPAAGLTGTLADARLSTNVTLLNANQVFTGSNCFSGAVVAGGELQAAGLNVNGPLRATSDLGLVLDAADRPLVTRGHNAFTSGAYAGAGRWGLFMENASLTLGIPPMPYKTRVQVATYNADSTLAGRFFEVNSDGEVVVDPEAKNDAQLVPGLIFGNGSGEGIASKRTAGGNQWGLDFYAGFENRMSVLHNGNVGIGTTNPATKLEVNGTVTAAAFNGAGGGLTALDAGALGSGTVPQARLSTNVALLNSSPTFSGSVKAGGDLIGPRLWVGSLQNLTGDCASIAGGINNTNYGPRGFLGGGSLNLIDSATECSVIAGGSRNTASSTNSTVGGGDSNTADGQYGTVGGGKQNTASGLSATVAGGEDNTASGNWATVGGGGANSASATNATVPGGAECAASANYSFAAGRRAKANHQGAFVWADSQEANFASTGSDQFLIRASGGVGIGKTAPATALDVNGTVTATSFAGNGAQLTAIGTSALADNSVTSAKLADGTVATADLDDGAVTSAKLASDSASLAKVSADYMAIKAGYVGIGTSSPKRMLQVCDGSGTNGDGGRVQIGGTGENGDPKLIYFGAHVYLGENDTHNQMELKAGQFYFNVGNVGIGTTSPGRTLHVNGRIRMATWTADGDTAVYKNDNGDIGVQASDARLKQNVARIPNALDAVRRMTGVTFNWRGDAEGAKKTVGLVAQEVQAALPELTFECRGEDGETYLGVHYDKVAAVLVNAIQEQQKQIEDQRAEIMTLKAREKEIQQLRRDLAELKALVKQQISH